MLVKNKLPTNCFVFLILFLFFSGVIFVFAQEKELEIEYPNIPGAEELISIKTPLPIYIKYIFNLVIITAGVLTLLVLIIGGVRYLTSRGSPTIKHDALNQIANSFFASIILLSSYLILYTINPEFVFFKFPEIKETTTSEISPIPLAERPYVFKEIPIGYFIDKTFEKERLNKIEELSNKIRIETEKLLEIGKELKILMEKCKCNQTNPNCQICIYGESCPCTFCEGDPCPLPIRNQIEGKKEEISKKIEEINKLKKDLEEQKNILTQYLENIKKTEEEMLNCFPYAINYNYLIAFKNITKIEIKEWNNLKVSPDEANFYCLIK